MIKKQPIKQYWAQDKAAFEALKAERGCSGSYALLLVYDWDVGVAGWWVENGSFGEAVSAPLTPIGEPAGGGITLNYQDDVVVIKGRNTGLPHAYEWSNVSGFGAKYDLPTMPVGMSPYWYFSGGFSRNGDVYVINLIGENEGFVAFPWDNASGFGTAYALPVAAAFPNASYIGSTGDLFFTPNDDAIVAGGLVAINNWGFVAIEWDTATGFGTKYPLPTEYAAENNSGRSEAAMHPDGNVIAFGGSPSATISPIGIDVYPFDPVTGFGTRYASPAVDVLRGANCLAFSPTGGALAVGFYDKTASNTTPKARVYRWDSATGFGAAYDMPNDFPSDPYNDSRANMLDVQFNHDGTIIAFCWGVTPYIIAYEWSDANGFGARITSPTSVPDVTGGTSYDGGNYASEDLRIAFTKK